MVAAHLAAVALRLREHLGLEQATRRAVGVREERGPVGGLVFVKDVGAARACGAKQLLLTILERLVDCGTRDTHAMDAHARGSAR